MTDLLVLVLLHYVSEHLLEIEVIYQNNDNTMIVVGQLVARKCDLRFTYVVPGWDSTASDSGILKDALRKYYVLDAGFILRKRLITQFRLTCYHLKELS